MTALKTAKVMIILTILTVMAGLVHADDTLFFEGFSVNENSWEENISGTVEQMWFESDFYYIKRLAYTGRTQTTLAIPIDQTKDFMIETKIRTKTGDPGAFFGITLAQSSHDTFWDFAINSSGNYKIYKNNSGAVTYYKDLSYNSYLLRGNNKSNTLKIKKSGTTLEFIANERVLFSTVFEDLPQPQLGFFIEGNQEIAVHYLTITQSTASSQGACDSTPGAVTLVSPTGSTTFESTPSFSWAENSCATWYKLYLAPTSKDFKYVQWYETAGTDPAYPDVNCTGGTCTITPNTSLASGNYEWWIRTYNETYGQGEWSSGGSFTIEGLQALPEKTELISPSGAIDNDGTTTFTWKKDQEATWYRISIENTQGTYWHGQWYETQGNDPSYPDAVCTGQECATTFNITFPAGDYTWWVKGWNDTGSGKWSDGMSYTVEPEPDPDPDPDPDDSDLAKEINEKIDMLTDVSELTPMIDEIGTVLTAVLAGDSSIVTISPSMDTLDITNLPESIHISADFGSGYTPEGGTSVYTGSMVIDITNLTLNLSGTSMSLTADMEMDADKIKRDSDLVLDGGMTMDIDVGMTGNNAVTVTGNVNFESLTSLEYEINGGIDLSIPSMNLTDGTISEPVVLTFNNLATVDYQLNGKVKITQVSNGYDIWLNLATGQGNNIKGTVRVNIDEDTEQVIVFTPGGDLQVEDYTMDINNVIIDPEVCPEGPAGGNVVVSDGTETTTVTFKNDCTYTVQ